MAESEIAFLKLGNSSIVKTAVARAQAAKCAPEVSLWVAPAALEAWRHTPAALLPQCPVAVEGTLAEVALRTSADLVLIHDAQRPLTLSASYDRVVESLKDDVVAARPAHVVVDTLKIVDDNMRITGTLNRDTVQSLTSPEGYVASAITLHQPNDGWSLSVAENARREFVRGDQESLKVREPADVLLVESFLAWQTIS
ncbi:MAG: hypothetical protein RIS75_473 [Actinomycetota bacterium]